MDEFSHWDDLPPTPVLDGAELQRRYRTLGQVVRLPGDGTVRLVRREGWVAVPTEPLSEADAPGLLDLCEKESRQELWALSLRRQAWRAPDGSPVWPAGLELPATHRGLEALLREVASFVNTYALLPEDAAWTALAMGPSDYGLVLGRPEAVERVLGPVARAHQAFEEYASDLEEPLRAVLEALRDRYPALPPGQELLLEEPWATWGALEDSPEPVRATRPVGRSGDGGRPDEWTELDLGARFARLEDGTTVVRYDSARSGVPTLAIRNRPTRPNAKIRYT